MDDDHAADAVDLLREQLQMGWAALEAIDRKLALVIPVVGGVAALVVPGVESRGFAAGLLIAGLLVAILAAVWSLWGMLTAPAHLGPNARFLAWRVRQPYPDYYRATAQALQASITTNADVGHRKASRFNLAAASAAWSILLMIVARLLEVR